MFVGAVAKGDNVVVLGTDVVASEADGVAANVAVDADLMGVVRHGHAIESKYRVKLSCVFHPPCLESGMGEETSDVDGAAAVTSAAASAE